MKRVIMAAVLAASTLAFGSAAYAADMPYKPMSVAPAYNSWTGFYIGVNAGPHSSSYGQHYVSGSYFSDTSMDFKGWQYEVEALYLHQFRNNFVVGAKTAIGFGGGSGTHSANNCIGCVGYTDTTDTGVKVRWIGSTQAILGYSFMDDKLLAYVGGGLAYGQFQTTSVENWSGFGYSGSYSTTDNTWNVGRALEVGAMYRITDNLVAKVFYRDTQVNLNTHSDTYSALSTKYHDQAVLAGISWKF